MINKLIAALALALLLVGGSPPVTAQPAPQTSQTQVFGAWTRVGRAPDLNAGTTTSSTILNFAGPVARVCNNSATIPAYVSLGGASVTATLTGSTLVPASICITMNATGATYVAGITASSTANIQTELGTGTPFSSLGAPAGGGGGAVSSVFGRTGAVVAETNDYTIAQINGLGTGVATALGNTAGGAGGFAFVGTTPPTGVASNGLKGTYPGPGLADVNTIATSLSIGGATIGTDALGVTGTATISAKTKIGTGSFSADDTLLLTNRTVTTPLASGGAHAYRDESTYTPSASGGYASYDAIPTFTGSVASNHLHAFQARPATNVTATLTDVSGLTSQATINNTGPITSSYGVQVFDALGTGTVTNQYAFACQALTRGTSNYCLYNFGAANNYLGTGTTQIGTGGTLTFGTGFSTYGALLSHDASGVVLDNPNITIVNGVLTLAASTARIFASATDLQLVASTGKVQHGATDVASGAVAQTLTFQGNTASTTNGPLALIRGAGGGSSTSVGGELRLSGGLSSAAAGTGGAVTIYTAPAAAGNAAVLAFQVDSQGAVKISKGWTVTTLPTTHTAGARGYVTDQLTTCAAIGVAPTGGGAVTCPVFDNGIAWVGG